MWLCAATYSLIFLRCKGLWNVINRGALPFVFLKILIDIFAIRIMWFNWTQTDLWKRLLSIPKSTSLILSLVTIPVSFKINCSIHCQKLHSLYVCNCCNVSCKPRQARGCQTLVFSFYGRGMCSQFISGSSKSNRLQQ